MVRGETSMRSPLSGRVRQSIGTAAAVLLGMLGKAAAHPVDPALLLQIQPSQRLTTPSQSELIEQGRRLFNQENFNGNGRTCASCHPASNNFTLDPQFIASLPPSDPLFVAEFNPQLS